MCTVNYDLYSYSKYIIDLSILPYKFLFIVYIYFYLYSSSGILRRQEKSTSNRLSYSTPVIINR